MLDLSFVKDKLSAGYQFVTGSIVPLFSKKLFEKSGKVLGSFLGQSSLGKIAGSMMSALYQKGFHFDFIKRNGYRCLAKECAKNTLGKTPIAGATASFIFDVFYESETDSYKIIRNLDKAATIASIQLLLTHSIETLGLSAEQYVTIQTGAPGAGAFTKFLLEAGCRSTLSATTTHLFEKYLARDRAEPIVFLTPEFLAKFRTSFY